MGALRKELDYFTVRGKPGGDQRWFWDPVLRIGGCGAIAACDSCIMLARTRGLSELYPYDAQQVSRRDYKQFAHRMKAYLRPGHMGLPKLELYTAGFGRYLTSIGMNRLTMTEFGGDAPVEEAEQVLCAQLDEGYPIPCMMLQHTAPEMKEYIWHWFPLTGYDCRSDGLWVQAVTYGAAEWLNFKTLWNTGSEERGGLILYREL